MTTYIPKDQLAHTNTEDFFQNGEWHAVLEARIEPRELFFGSVNVGTNSAEQIATLTNTGISDLPITSIEAVGVFSVITDAPATLLPGQSCTLRITMTPTTVGAVTGAVLVQTGDAAGHEWVRLQGAGR